MTLRCGVLRLCLVALLPTIAAALRVVSWNVYYKALDDAAGRSAVVKAIDALPALDVAVIVEAGGDTPSGKLASWSANSSALASMGVLTTQSEYEELALFHGHGLKATYVKGGEFTPGRPYLVARLQDGQDTDVWIVAVHLPHFLDTDVSPGAILAAALRNASSVTGVDVSTASVVLAGDWNEFQWEDNPCPQPIYPRDCRAEAKKRMDPLWVDFFHGGARDIVEDHTTTCCTKWCAADRGSTSYTEWRFEYDHVFATGSVGASPKPELVPYEYPGVAAPCGDAACTGEDPPKNKTATAQGSWHRGWVVEF